jgi:23S rRNA (cytosine1962-C5)-methyltransferase
MPQIFLKPGREKSVINHHPWLFSGAVKNIGGNPQTGDIVDVLSGEKLLGRGIYNSGTSIAVRMISFDETPVDRAFWRNKIERAFSARKETVKNTTAYRMVHGEADLLPGLTIDRYGEYLCLQISTAGMDRLREELVGILQELFQPKGIYERSDLPSRKAEGLKPVSRIICGEIPDLIEITENGLNFAVDLLQGQKTGFFIDQRDNRQYIREIAQNRKVLNCFGYSGGFSVYAAAGGALETLTVDISPEAVFLAKRNLAVNGFTLPNHSAVAADVFDYLRTVPQGKYDLIILDPPAFTKNKETVQAAARGYKEINRQAVKALNSGGILMTCSCSQHIDRMLFQKIVHDAAMDARKDLQILAVRGQAPDHPINISHPEGEYLKCLVCRVM